MDGSSPGSDAPAGRPGLAPAREDGGNVISLSDYRQRRLGHPDDDPPRPTPQAARAVRYADRYGYSAVAARPDELAII